MDYLTYHEARRRRPDSYTERQLREEARRQTYRTAFLSYASCDDEFTSTTLQILTEHGATVYIDKGDPRLPEQPSTYTGHILREMIRICSRFVLQVTPTSSGSRWIPWELGLADGIRKPTNVALFPIARESFQKHWTTQEYLGLYPRIGLIGSTWIVEDPEGKQQRSLKSWLAEGL